MNRAASGSMGANVSITGGTSQWNDGLVGSPSIAFASSPSTGIYQRVSGATIDFTVGGTAQGEVRSDGYAITGGNSYQWNSGVIGSGSDLFLFRDAANTLALKNANSAQEFRVYAGNGGFISQVKSVTESLTIAAAATTVSATTIPAGAILLGVAVRVTTVIPTAATFTVTTTVGGTTLNTAAVSTAANSTDPGTAAGASYRAAATTVTITPNLTPAAATGVVRLQYYYLQVTPPTS